MDKRAMVRNNARKPLNLVGLLFCSFKMFPNKKPTNKIGTGCLISSKHVITAAHNIFSFYDQKVLTKGQKRADSIIFFLEPLFFKNSAFKSLSNCPTECQIDFLQNGIKAQVLYMDQRFQTVKYEDRASFDWVVLQLITHQMDNRTKLGIRKQIFSNFQYDYQQDKDIPIYIAGYPQKSCFEDVQQNFQSEQANQTKKIIRKQKDIHALYINKEKPSTLSPCKKFLYYQHSTSKGTSGSPLLRFNDKIRRWETIGIHIRSGIGLLLSSISLKSQIQQLLLKTPNQVCHLNNYTEVQQYKIKRLFFGNQICPQYKLIRHQNSEIKLIQLISSKPYLFPFLYSISENFITQEQLTKFFQSANKIPTIQNLTFNFSNLTSQTLIQLVGQALRLPNLLTIDFDQNNIDNQGIQHLSNEGSKLPNLKQISLENNNISDEGIKKLFNKGFNFTQLKAIYLCYNSITCEGLKELEANTVDDNKLKFNKVKKLYMRNNQITGYGLKEFSAHLQKFPRIKVIDLSNNKITNEGMQAIASNGDKLHNLKKLILGNNFIQNRGLTCLSVNANLFVNLNTIEISTNKISDDGFLSLIENGHKLTKLKRLDLRNNCITGELLDKIQSDDRNKLPKLKEIYLNSNKVTGNGLKGLCSFCNQIPKLKQIYLGHNLITDLGIKQFCAQSSKLKKLKVIELNENFITKVGIMEVFQMKKPFLRLEEIYLYKNKITNEQFKQIQKNLENLKFKVYL